MAFAEMGTIINGVTTIVLEFQLDYSDNCCFGFERSRRLM